MDHQINHERSFPVLQVALSPGEVLTAEAGAMMARSSSVAVELSVDGAPAASRWLGVLRGIVAWVRRLFGAELFLVQRFTAERPAWVWIAPKFCGSLLRLQLQAEAWTLAKGAFVASSGAVTLKVLREAGPQSFGASPTYFVEASGVGELFLAAHGGIELVLVDGALLVDPAHLLGFDPALRIVSSPPERASALGLSGSSQAPRQAQLLEFRGRGRVMLQTRGRHARTTWLAPALG